MAFAFRILDTVYFNNISSDTERTHKRLEQLIYACPGGNHPEQGRGIEGRAKLVTGEGHGRARPCY